MSTAQLADPTHTLKRLLVLLEDADIPVAGPDNKLTKSTALTIAMCGGVACWTHLKANTLIPLFKRPQKIEVKDICKGPMGIKLLVNTLGKAGNEVAEADARGYLEWILALEKALAAIVLPKPCKDDTSCQQNSIGNGAGGKATANEIFEDSDSDDDMGFGLFD